MITSTRPIPYLNPPTLLPSYPPTNPSVGIGRTAALVTSGNPPHANHLVLAQAAIEVGVCDRVIIAVKPESKQKANLASPLIRLEMFRLLLEELFPSLAEQKKILVNFLPKTYEDQLALIQRLGHPEDPIVRKITDNETFPTYITGLPPSSLEVTKTHHDVFSRLGHGDGISSELKSELKRLGVSHSIHPAPEEKQLSSTMIRGLLSTFLKNPNDSEALGALKEIYQGAPKALAFLRKHAAEFTKLVKR
jgi:hypothetical protein